MFLVLHALRRPVTVIVAMLAIVLGAALAIRRAPVDIFPELGVPVIYVVQPYAGMSPTQMEGQIVTYYEYHFLYIAGIEHIESQSIQGMAMVKLYFHPGANIAQAMAQVTAMAFRSTSFMPPGTLPPFIVRFDAGSIPVGQLVFSSEQRGESEIQDLALYRVRPVLATLPGVSAPPPSGGKVRTIVVYANPERMRAYRVSPEEIAQVLGRQNLTLPAGNVRTGDLTTIAATNAMVTHPKELADIPLRTGSGPTVFLRDVARVEDGADVVYNIALVNGRRTVYMPLTKRADASTLDVVGNIKAALPRMRALVPEDVRIDFAFDQSVYVTGAISGLVTEGVLGAVLTSLMVLVFLGNWRSALIVILTIPFSILAAVAGLRLAGQTINVMTLGGLTLAVGILVDEATVAIENIHTHLARGKPSGRAVLDSMAEVMQPRFWAMLCVIAVFIPALFMVGVGRALFPPLAMAVAFSMIASYLISSTLVPVLATWLFAGHVERHRAGSDERHRTGSDERHRAGSVERHRAGSDERHRADDAAGDGSEPRTWFGRIQSGYGRFTRRMIGLRWLVALVYLATCGPALWLAGHLGSELFPRVDTGQFQMRIRAPDGTRLERTEAIVREVDRTIRELVGEDGVEITLANIGNPAWTYPVNGIYVWNSGPHEALLLVALKKGKRRPPLFDLQELLRRRLHESLPGVRFSFEAGDIVSQVLNFGAPTPINVTVSGNKLGETRVYAEKLVARMKDLFTLRDVQIPLALDYPTLEVRIDRERAGQLGVTVDRIGRSLVAATSSSVLVAPNFWINPQTGIPYRVAIRVPESEIRSAEDVKNLPVMPDGSPRPLLRDLATVSPGKTFGELDHRNSQRTINVVANVSGRDMGQAMRDVEEAVASLGKPPRGLNVAIRGQVDEMRKALSSLREGLALAVLVVLLLLTASFQSIRDPLIVLSTIPAVLLGVLGALQLTGSTLNVQSLMGAIMAIGVAVANAVLIVTLARDRRWAGDDAATAALAAARGRMRPIVMTSVAMIAGMLPMALGLGEGGEQTAPLGRAVIGGLFASMAATLVVLPSIYVLAARKGAYRSISLDPGDALATAAGLDGGAGPSGAAPKVSP